MSVLDIAQSLLVTVVCGALFSLFVSKWPEEEKRVGMYCWGAHVASALVIVAIYVFHYTYGDLITYFVQGRRVAAYVEYDLPRHLPEVFKLLLQQEHGMPAAIHGDGTSTGSMVAVGALISLFTTSLWAGSIIVSSLSALGQALLWLGVRELVPSDRRTAAMWSCFLAPSAVFWSSSLLKEAFALLGVGMIVRGAAAVRGGSIVYLALVALGALCIGLFKPYVLFPLIAALGVYGYWSKAASKGGVRLSPVALLSGALITLGLVVALGKIFPMYAVDVVAESIEHQRDASLTVQGGSDFRAEGEVESTSSSRGGLGLLADIPFTVLTALFRPLVIESRNWMMLINSLETTMLLLVFVTSVRRMGAMTLVRWVWRSPDLIASVVFVILFSAAVGMATTNLGTLSRYRLPMMPFYFYFLFAARAASMAMEDVTTGTRGKPPDLSVVAVPGRH